MSRIDLRPKHLVLLDAGHGINTPGKRSPRWADGRQLLEWQFNRTLALRIQQALCDLGYDARLLVPEDDDLPLQARVKRATTLVEEHKGKGGIFPNRLLISIHANASTTPDDDTCPLTLHQQEAYTVNPSGWECFANGSSWNSRHMAALLLKHAAAQLPDTFPIRGAYGNVRQTGVRCEAKVAKFFMLKNAPCAAVLTENLFMDCKKDCDYLFTPEALDTLARIHIDAIDENFVHNTD